MREEVAAYKQEVRGFGQQQQLLVAGRAAAGSSSLLQPRELLDGLLHASLLALLVQYLAWIDCLVSMTRCTVCTLFLQITAIVEEYFSSGDVSNAADSLTDLGAPETMGHYFVKRLITLALDRKDKEREMASSLLSNLYAEVSISATLA